MLTLTSPELFPSRNPWLLWPEKLVVILLVMLKASDSRALTNSLRKVQHYDVAVIHKPIFYHVRVVVVNGFNVMAIIFVWCNG